MRENGGKAPTGASPRPTLQILKKMHSSRVSADSGTESRSKYAGVPITSTLESESTSGSSPLPSPCVPERSGSGVRTISTRDAITGGSSRWIISGGESIAFSGLRSCDVLTRSPVAENSLTVMSRSRDAQS
eukprot:Amastigsp_a340270_76.p4 type:complete len:131 gc:universal Amastigsp_a340270_76:653-1045(+)